MKDTIKFIQSTLLTGFTIILPLLILFTFFNWVAGFLINVLRPFTESFVNQTGVSVFMAHVFVISGFLCVCLLLGYYTKTKMGKEVYEKTELRLLTRIPGYKIVKETIMQFMGNKKPPFSSVALVKIFGNQTMVTAFVTDEHPDGSFTVFVPTGPNPTSGNIYHVQEEQLIKVNATVEDTMRSILGCGAGSCSVVKYDVKIDELERRNEAKANREEEIKQAS